MCFHCSRRVSGTRLTCPLLAGRERLGYKYISLADVFATPRTDGIDLIGEGRLCEICPWPDLDLSTWCQLSCLTIINI